MCCELQRLVNNFIKPSERTAWSCPVIWAVKRDCVQFYALTEKCMSKRGLDTTALCEGSNIQSKFIPSKRQKITWSVEPRRRSAALLAVAGQDVSVGGCDAAPTSAAQPHGFQLGGVRPAAGAGALKGLLEHRAEGDQGVRAGGVTTVALAACQ